MRKKPAKPIVAVETTKKLYLAVAASGVMYPPFGEIYFKEDPKQSGGNCHIEIPKELGLLGENGVLEVRFRVLKRGRLKKNPWYSGKPGYYKPPKFPEDCTATGIIKQPVFVPCP